MKPREKLNESFNDDKKDNETTNIDSTDTALSSMSTMNNESSVITDQSSSAEEASVRPEDAVEQAFVCPEDAAEQVFGRLEDTVARRRRNNHRRIQNVLLVWLDTNINESSDDCLNTITALRQEVHEINMFTDGEECVRFIHNIIDIKACMIVSGSLGQHIIPLVHDMSQVDSIFIFCNNKKHHEQWTKDWSKIKGVFTEISPICEALKEAAQQCEQNAISMSFVATSEDLSKKKLDQLDPSFMYTQILKEILLSINFEPKHFVEFIEYCHDVFDDNTNELRNIGKLEQNYRDETPIWWYTLDCFLYRMLNRAARLMDVDIMIKMGFFIDDLHEHIDELHQKQYNNQNSTESFIVYRGQGMSRTEFDQMSKTKGGLVSFNNFLSTSKNQAVSLGFANGALTNSDLMGVLFIMTINPSQSTTPFASIIDVSYFRQEDEVLFAMHTVFRINNIKSMDENQRLYQVDLTLTNDNDKDLRQLTARIREETKASTGWGQLGELLFKTAQPKKAEQVYNILLGQATEEIDKAYIYHRIGLAKVNLNECQEAFIFFERALEIRQRLLPPNHSDLAKSYNSIGAVYHNMGEYSKALSSYEKALAICHQSLPPNHHDLAKPYNNIGAVYHNMGEYSKALSYYKKALAIRQQSLPANHPDLAQSYNSHGKVYNAMGKHSNAVEYYEKALAVQQQSLPANHPNLAMSYGYIGNVYSDMGEYSKVLSSHEKALAIKQQSLPPNHPDLASSYSNIGNVYYNTGEYLKALSYYEKALAIWQQSLPPNHPDLAISYSNIGNVYRNMSEYLEALSYYEKALAVQQQSLPANHPNLAMSYGYIGNVYSDMREYSKALPFCELAVTIGQQSLPADHSLLQWHKNNLFIVKTILEYLSV